MGDEKLPEDVRALFRSYAARRRRDDRPCEECGTIMENVTTRRRFCSAKCLMRQRRRAQASPDAAAE